MGQCSSYPEQRSSFKDSKSNGPSGGRSLHYQRSLLYAEVQVRKMKPGWDFSLWGCFCGSKRSNCHFLLHDEQDILNRLGDGNAMSNIKGGTWTSVLYRVELQDISRAVVVKKLQNESGSAVDASLSNRCQSEVNLLGNICHGNIISLADYIAKDDFILLIYDHMENGSLHQWLHPDPPQLDAEGVLDWPKRRAIAIGIAEGLCYLHHGRNHPIVHHNINTTNILLDPGLKPKIAGFDLARINLAGTDQPVPIWELPAVNMVGYTAPEYTTAVNSKVDVYSLGVVLLELVTGRVAYEPIEDGHLATFCKRFMENTGDFSRVVDMAIPDRARYLKEMAAMFKLGVDCTVKEPQQRPSMHEVLYRLRNRGR